MPISKSKQILFTFFKYSLIALSCWYLYDRLAADKDLIIKTFDEFDLLSITQLSLIALIGFIFNWLTESNKWKIITKPIAKLNLKEAVFQTLAAHAIAVMTPQKIGEFGARPFFFPKHQARKVVAYTMINSMLQLGATLFFSIIGIIYFLINFRDVLYNTDHFPIIGLLIVMLLSLLFFTRRKFRKRLKAFFNVAVYPDDVKRSGLLSLLRYMIFSHQYFLLLYLFNDGMDYLQAMPVLFMVYLFISVVPSVFVFDIAVRGGLGIFFFGLIDVPASSVILTATFMWLANAGLPALIGNIFVARYKVKKQTKVFSA
jgi:hypothetical protein